MAGRYTQHAGCTMYTTCMEHEFDPSIPSCKKSKSGYDSSGRYSGEFGGGRYPTTTDRNKPLETSPHYSDERFRDPQTVFGKPGPRTGHPGLTYDYSDRLWEWDYRKAEEAAKAAEASGAPKKSARYYDAFLTAYHGKPCHVEHVIAGVVASNGHPYAVFGYRTEE